jgi:hypothetical protein
MSKDIAERLYPLKIANEIDGLKSKCRHIDTLLSIAMAHMYSFRSSLRTAQNPAAEYGDWEEIETLLEIAGGKNDDIDSAVSAFCNVEYRLGVAA